MLRHRQTIPLDYSLCQDTVTVYHREGLTRQIHNAHLEFTHQQTVTDGVAQEENGFLLVVPGALDIAPGDKVAMGEHTPMVVQSVKPRYFYGTICHTEVRG